MNKDNEKGDDSQQEESKPNHSPTSPVPFSQQDFSDSKYFHLRKDFCHTDVGCLVVFVIFIVAQIAVFTCGALWGDVGRVLNNYDCYGNVCDREQNMKVVNNSLSGISTSGKPFVLQTNPTFWLESVSLCVKQCPTETLLKADDVKTYSTNTNTSLCRYNVPLDQFQVGEASTNSEKKWKVCALLPVLKQTPQLGGFCLPSTLSKNYGAGINRLRSLWVAMVRDVWIVKDNFFSLMGLALLFALLLSCCISMVPKASHYIILILTTIFILAVITMSWIAFNLFTKHLNSKTERGILLAESLNEKGLFILAVSVSVLGGVILVIVMTSICSLQALPPILSLCGTSVMKVKQVLLLPCMTILCLVAYFYAWLVSFTKVVSMSRVEIHAENECVQYVSHGIVPWFFLFHMISLLWMVDFLVACQQFVTSTVVMEWFIRHGLMNAPFTSIFHWIWRMISQHLGSVALSSVPFIPLRMVRCGILFLRSCMAVRWMRNGSRPSTVCTCSCLCAPAVCLHTNRAAYIISAWSGKGYWTAARDALNYINNHEPPLVQSLGSLCTLLLLLTKLATLMLALVLGLAIFMTHSNISFYILPVVLLSVMTFSVAHCVMCVFENTVDTLLMCRCILLSTAGDEVDNGHPQYGGWSFANQFETALSEGSELLRGQRGKNEATVAQIGEMEALKMTVEQKGPNNQQGQSFTDNQQLLREISA